MGLYSSLSVGTASLQAQSDKIDTISNNIANVNTVGYKSTQTNFSELIADDSAASYSPGGVLGVAEQLISLGGDITSAPNTTDIAVNGNGFFPVSQNSADSGDIAYTRAGSFTEDANGNLVNSNGFYLQGWALDSTGTPVTTDLVPVNVATLAETPVPTNAVTIQANLDAAQTVYGGTPAYNASDDTANMASGSVTPQFDMPITIIDSLGTAHTFQAGFLNTGQNTWAVEVYSDPATDVTGATDGQIAAGTVTFNGDGTLATVSTSLTTLSAQWTDNAAPSSIAVNWGTAGAEFGTLGATVIGRSDGLSQFSSAYKVANVQQNGVQPSTLESVSIGANGFVTGNYENGSTQNLYQVPMANFVNPDGLQNISGDAFLSTTDSGTVNYLVPGTSGSGIIDPSSLEASNVDLSTQLTDLIVAQNAYQSSAKLLSTSDTMLQDLVQMG